MQNVGEVKKDSNGKWVPAGWNPTFSFSYQGSEQYDVGPQDFATIYTVTPLWTASTPITGEGQTIVVIEDTNMNAADWTTFRSAFALSSFSGTLAQVHPAPPSGTNNCGNPGTNGDAVGSAADTRRTADAWDRGRPVNRGAIHDQAAGAALSGVEDIPAQLCRWDHVHRFVRGSYNFFQAVLWPGHSSSRPEAIGEHQRDEQSDRRVDSGPGDRCLSLGGSAASPDSRPCWRIRSSVHPPHSCNGDPRSPPPHHSRRGRTATLNGSSDRYGANLSTISSCSARRTCAVS